MSLKTCRNLSSEAHVLTFLAAKGLKTDLFYLFCGDLCTLEALTSLKTCGSLLSVASVMTSPVSKVLQNLTFSIFFVVTFVL